MTELLGLCLATGAAAGVLAGLLGIGGGLVIVPALYWGFSLSGFEPQIVMRMAVGTSLATVVLTSIASTYTHHTRGAVVWAVVARLTLGLAIGSYLGARWATAINDTTLQVFFALFTILAGGHMLLPVKDVAIARTASKVWTAPAGLGIGVVSSLLGIGGGTLTVPFLIWNGLDIRRAIACSAACGFPIALAGSATFVWRGLGLASLPEHTLGYVHLPAFFSLVTTSIVGAWCGARWTHRAPRHALRKGFGVLFLVVAARMLFTL